jgi:hypothetical protein
MNYSIFTNFIQLLIKCETLPLLNLDVGAGGGACFNDFNTISRLLLLNNY